jgi:hypothetical protein
VRGEGEKAREGTRPVRGERAVREVRRREGEKMRR